MKKKYEYRVLKGKVVREINYIPIRYIIATLFAVAEILAILNIVVWLCYVVPYFYLAALITQIGCAIKIVSSDDNPDYKVPWLLVVLVIPIVGFMLYFMFSSRKLKRKFIKRLKDIKNKSYEKDDGDILKELDNQNKSAANQARMITKISGAHLFKNTSVKYFPSGEDMLESLLIDLNNAQNFIFMEYFIIEEGKFWNSILDILKKKAKEGVEIKIVYDDIGCMSTLPGNYPKKLKLYGVEATQFSLLRGSADSEFNNRSHRKITVIDGKVGYTGGVNLADEYINEKVRFGHWKDNGVRLVGEGVWELTKLFLIDYGINVKYIPKVKYDCFPRVIEKAEGYVVPFGDGPRPLYKRNVGKNAIQNMLAAANKYMYITTPYLVIDNDLCQDIENAALRGVDVKIIVPHVPDKKFVFEMTKSYYHRLMESGVKIYEYEPGFIHAKTYIADDEYAMVGTINLDYRSLVHHFENGVWMYKCECISDIKNDIEKTLEKSIEITPENSKVGISKRFIRAVLRIFAPLM